MESRKVWQFSAATGWKEIPDFLENPKADSDCAKELELAGYSPHASGVSFGDELCGFSCEVYHRATEGKHPFRYIVMLEVACEIQYVAVTAFPDLVELLAKAAKIAELAFAAGQRDEAPAGIHKG